MFALTFTTLHLSVKNIKQTSTYKKLVLEFSDAQAEVFCSLFWV